MSRSRSFLFTLWTQIQVDAVRALTTRYMVMGHEICPETKREHWHAYMYFENARSWESVRKEVVSLSNGGFKLLMPKGDMQKIIAYCKKDGEFDSTGVPPKQGKRTDLVAYVENIEGGATDRDLWRDYPAQMLRYHRGTAVLRTHLLHERARNRGFCPMLVFVLWGPTGVGKTRRAYSTSKRLGLPLYSVPVPAADGRVWFPGYRGERLLLLDDFDGWIKYRTLLQLLGGYPIQVHSKGGFHWLLADRCIITSNTPPSEWYPYLAEGDKAPLYRRITKIMPIEEDSWSDMEEEDGELSPASQEDEDGTMIMDRNDHCD